MGQGSDCRKGDSVLSIVFSLLLTFSLSFSSDHNLDFWWKQLEGNSRDLKISACQKLKDIRNPRSIPYLSRALQDQDPLVRYQAAMSLGSHLDTRSLEALSKRFDVETDNYVKSEIRRNINQLKDYFAKNEAQSNE